MVLKFLWSQQKLSTKLLQSVGMLVPVYKARRLLLSSDMDFVRDSNSCFLSLPYINTIFTIKLYKCQHSHMGGGEVLIPVTLSNLHIKPNMCRDKNFYDSSLPGCHTLSNGNHSTSHSTPCPTSSSDLKALSKIYVTWSCTIWGVPSFLVILQAWHFSIFCSFRSFMPGNILTKDTSKSASFEVN